jgi:hypothetical protein
VGLVEGGIDKKKVGVEKGGVRGLLTNLKVLVTSTSIH